MDTAERDDRVMTIAAEALKKPLTERESFLRAVCQNDSDLYEEVSGVVTWEERMSTFLSSPLIDLIDVDSLGKPFEPQQKIAGRFDIIREIGDGGMGVVYEAYDNTREQRIAIKCAKPGFSRLQSPELNGALKVRHPNVCQLNDIHMASTDLGEVRFITMELLDGETLQSRLLRGKLASDEAMKIARQLCAGLAEAHRCGVVHGDLKPANIILAHEENKETRAVITDFGLAVNQNANTVLFGATPSYMAPELKKGGRVSPASDVYALGVILYEMVTGKKPFLEIAVNGDAPTPVAPSKLAKGLPGIWDDALLPCLALLPEKRPSVPQILAILDRKPFYRQPWVLIAALVLIAAGLLLWPPVYNYFHTPDVTLAILPVQSSTDLQPFGDQVLRDVHDSLAQEPRGVQKFKLVTPDVTQKKGASTLEQAQSLLPGTHALEVKLSNDQDGQIAVNAVLVNLETKMRLRNYSAHFAKSDESTLAGALASLISLSFHLPRAAVPETILPAAKAAYDRGNNYLAEGDYSYEKAIAQFQEAAKLDPHSPLPLAGLAEAYIIKRHSDRSSQVLDQIQNYVSAASRLNADSPHVLLASASLNTINGNDIQSAQDSGRALELESDNTEAWIRLGYANEDMKLFDQALVDYHKAIEINPGYYKPYEYLGAFYYYSQPNYAEGEKFFIKATELAPGRTDSYAGMGALLTAQARYPEAEKIYRKTLSIRETPENWNNLGVNLAYQKRDKEAIFSYERAIWLSPTFDFYRLNLGDAQRRLGRIQAANASYQEALALATANLVTNPKSEQERAFRAYCLARLHKDDAELEINEALTSTQSNSNIDKQSLEHILLFGVLTYEALGKRAMALGLANKTSPDLKKELEHHPDLADFNQDSRFTR